MIRNAEVAAVTNAFACLLQNKVKRHLAWLIIYLSVLPSRSKANVARQPSNGNINVICSEIFGETDVLRVIGAQQTKKKKKMNKKRNENERKRRKKNMNLFRQKKVVIIKLFIYVTFIKMSIVYFDWAHAMVHAHYQHNLQSWMGKFSAFAFFHFSLDSCSMC